MASLLRGQARKFENITKSLDKSVEKSIKRYRKNRAKATRIETVKKAYSGLSETARKNLETIGDIRGFNAAELVGMKTSQIVKKSDIEKQFKLLEKSLITKKKGIEYVKTAGEIKKSLASMKNVEKGFMPEKHIKVDETANNMKLYEVYKYFLQFKKYKQLQKSMSYEDFKKLMLTAYENEMEVVDVKMYQKAKKIYDKIQKLSQTKDASGSTLFGYEFQSSTRSEDGKGTFFGRGNKGFGTIEKEVYHMILDKLNTDSNASVDDIVKEVIEDIQSRKNNMVKSKINDMRRAFANMK